MHGQQHKPDRLVAEFLRHIAYKEEVSSRFRHFFVVNIQHSVVHPDIGKSAARRALTLRDFVLVMRENEVSAAAVNVDCVADIVARHRRALDVPARSALAERRIPVRLAGFRCLPHGKIHRVALFLADFDTRTRLQIVERLVRELAVLVEFRGFKVHVPVNLIRVTLVNKRLYDIDDDVHILGYFGVNIGSANVQALRVDEVLPDCVFGNLGRCFA